MYFGSSFFLFPFPNAMSKPTDKVHWIARDS